MPLTKAGEKTMANMKRNTETKSMEAEARGVASRRMAGHKGRQGAATGRMAR